MPGRILIIEDEPNLRKTLYLTLTEANFEVVEVTNCLDALLKLDDFVPDLVVLDEDLPLVDGWETCYLLHHARGLPVIILGDDFADEIWDRTLQAGADFYLRLPFNRLELKSRIKAILRRYRKNEIARRV